MATKVWKPRARFREKGGFSPVSGGYFTTDATCSSGTTYTDYGKVMEIGEYSFMRDQLNPNFFKRSRSGEMIISPLQVYREVQTGSGIFAKAQTIANSCAAPVKKAVYDILGPQSYWRLDETRFRIPRPSLIPDADISSAIAVASTKAWEASNQHAADILVDIAEMRQTLRMLRDPIQSSSAFLRKIQDRKGGKKGASVKDLTDYTQSMWLQYRYGIRPLVSSVQGVVKALTQERRPIRATHRGKYSVSKQGISNSVKNTFFVNYGYSMVTTDKVDIRTGLVIDEAVELAQALGVDASGMLALPWELVPFSFVADWFANVGDFLGALAPYLTKSPVCSFTSITRDTSTTFSVTGTTVNAGYTLLRGVTETRSAHFFEKVRYGSIAPPTIAFKPSAISNVLADKRLIDSFALLSQQFNKVFKG